MKYDTYEEYEQAINKFMFPDKLKGTADEIDLEIYTLWFHNKEHFKNWQVKVGYYHLPYPPIDQINTYNDALLYKDHKQFIIRDICEYIIKGDIEIYE